ncbi:hypothetical protein [Empedobacter sp. UBA7620]|uniref:hypothetical protein n=1 Tax=Empedobacter sp. UBA7620 TaxID=1946452 RepID=UPI0025BDCEBC|nr:hypothetical protein [Empedobacter sp. UBA7620]
MKNLKIVLVVSILSAFTLTSCQNKTEEPTVTAHEEHMSDMMQPSQTMAYNVGDKVPNKQVCMVNNAYMGKDQFEVPYDGKTYYGCCNMCVERIPNDETSRKAKDPFTGKEIDKANAYIVLKDQQGNVDYFENEENYKKYSQL